MIITRKSEAIRSLCPNAWFKVRENKDVTWIDMKGDSTPSESAITAEIARLDKVYEDNKYQRDRVSDGTKTYDSLSNQLDMLYHDLVAGKLDATGTWAKHIKAVKDANPKP